MSTLAEHANNYLTVRRALGFKLVGEGQLLAEFVACADVAGQRTITTQFAIDWARRPASGSPNYLSRRLRAIRAFARYLHALDPACEIPPIELLPASKYRPAPYLYRDEEIVALMRAAGGLRPPLRAATLRTLIGLLGCTGLRIGEAIRLDREDFDPTPGLLTVRDSKFGKSREVLLHPSAVRALDDYGELRDRLCPHPKERSFFITTRGTRLCHPTIYVPFRALLDQVGVKHPSSTDTCGYMICATVSLSRRCWAGIATVGMSPPRMPLLSTYLGHVDPAATYWYLSAAPELLHLAAERLEQATGGRS